MNLDLVTLMVSTLFNLISLLLVKYFLNLNIFDIVRKFFDIYMFVMLCIYHGFIIFKYLIIIYFVPLL